MTEYILYFVETCPREKGFCMTENGDDQNAGVIKKEDGVNVNTDELRQECLQWCKSQSNLTVTGCEVIQDQWNQGCYAHTKNVAFGNKADNHFCWVFSKCEGGNLLLSIMISTSNVRWDHK